MHTQTLSGRLTRVNATPVSEAVSVTLEYDGEAEPFAVTVTFSQPGSGEEISVWLISRQLFEQVMEASHRLVGDGDVRLILYGLSLKLCVTSPDGHADIMVPAEQVRVFLDGTAEDVRRFDCPARVDLMIDRFLTETLS